MERIEKDKYEFANLLSQLLGVAGKDVDLWDQTLYVDLTRTHSELVSLVIVLSSSFATVDLVV